MNEEYYMNLARQQALLADCEGRRVGAVLVMGLTRNVIAEGRNGTPTPMKPCREGGCHRCANRDKYLPGTVYDLCVCVHAEQKCLLHCAFYGIPTDQSVLYTTIAPCLGCCKELIQAGVEEVIYEHEWTLPSLAFADDYSRMLQLLNARQLTMKGQQ